jgi:hypothetical protein
MMQYLPFADARALAVYDAFERARLSARKGGTVLTPLSRSEQKTFLEFLNRLMHSHNESSRVPIDNTLIPTRPHSGKQESDSG